MNKILLLLGVGFSFQVQSFPCFVTLVKDSCWKNYNVEIAVTNGSANKLITKVSIPKGKSWARQQFACQPADILLLSATFTPVFWENDTKKTYVAKREWKLPTAVKKGDTAWNITTCYPAQFAEVPFPPDADGHCKCNMDELPPIQPQ